MILKKLESFRYQEEVPVSPVTQLTFEAYIEQILALKDEQFQLNAVMGDPVSGKMTAAFREELIATAVACGEFYAAEYSTAGKDIYQLLAQEKLTYQVQDMPAGGGHVIFAQYVEPDQITIFSDSLDQYHDLIQQTRYRGSLARDVLQQVLLAHEFFHFIEFKQRATIVTRNKKLTLWRLFGYEYQTTLISLSEIAAMTFAQHLLKFTYSAFVLDMLLTYPYSSELSYQIYEAVAARPRTVIPVRLIEEG